MLDLALGNLRHHIIHLLLALLLEQRDVFLYRLDLAHLLVHYSELVLHFFHALVQIIELGDRGPRDEQHVQIGVATGVLADATHGVFPFHFVY